MSTSRKRTPPSQLVNRSVAKPYARVTWYDRLRPQDKAYVREVVASMREQPHVAPYSVADALIAELSLSASQSTVVRTLRGMLNGKA